MPVGNPVLGRMLNVTGDPIDAGGPIAASITEPIHRKPPTFTELSTKEEILVTGIKVVDLMAPYLKGGKIGLIRWCWCWENGYYSGAYQQHS